MSWYRIDGDTLKIRVTALPVDGAANKELIRFLADVFKVRQRDVALTQGETSRRKQFVISSSAIEPLSLLP